MFRKSFVPSSIESPRQEPSVSPSLSVLGIKRKAPDSRLQFQPPQQQKPIGSCHSSVKKMDNLFCKICQVPCSSNICLEQHLRGQKHSARLLKLKSGKKNGEEKGNQQRECKLCEIPGMDENAFKLHLSGQKHKARLQAVQLGRKDGEKKANQKPWCELCGILCMDENAFKLHVAGQKHKARLETVQLGREYGEERVNQRLWCEICRLWCIDEKSFKLHLEGKRHILQLQAVEEKNKAREAGDQVAGLEWEELE
ncbi:uncharacterized protein LOC131146235 isoform X2 [Malania oleifera]|uniref:uncharacterized protein LOC131146235 isoform X2 n=1 Tax=Malania oleifera TaxID=397392 RepID=UPI0025AE8F34|nr:uncharacterized protein LOC131146235 isoform X2 [Malania oleifera]